MNPHAQDLTDHPAEPKPAPEFEPGPRGFWTSKTGLVAIAFLLIAAFLLFSEHRAHALGVLPYLLLLACPLLHLFMHGSHGGHGGRGRHIQHKEAEPSAQNDTTRAKGA